MLRVERTVHPEVRRTPSGVARGQEPRIRCPKCHHVCFEGYEHLEKVTNDVVRVPERGHYRADGFVPVPWAG